MHLSKKSNTGVLEIENGKYDIPDDIDEFDKEIAKTFWVDE
jgi:hypothetical protein